MAKGFLGVDWDALGKFAGGMLVGDMKGAADALSEADTQPPPPSGCETCAKGEKHAPGAEPCKARDGAWHCVGHNEDGNCIMSTGR